MKKLLIVLALMVSVGFLAIIAYLCTQNDRLEAKVADQQQYIQSLDMPSNIVILIIKQPSDISGSSYQDPTNSPDDVEIPNVSRPPT